MYTCNRFLTAGAMIFVDSEGNFIGNTSFEDNHAYIGGGKGKLEDAISAIRGAWTKYTARVEILFCVVDGPKRDIILFKTNTLIATSP